MRWTTLALLTVGLTSTAVQGLHHKLTKRELQKVFGVEEKHQVPEYHLIKTERISTPTGLRLRFSAWNDTYDIDVKPNTRLVSPHLQSIIRNGENGSLIAGLPLDHQCHYQGQVKSHNDAPVAISDCRTLMGTLVLDDHFLVLQTVPHRVQHMQVEKHLVFKREANLLTALERNIEEELVKLNEVHNDFCDTTDLFSLNYTVPPAGQLDSPFIFPQLDPITLEIGLFLDSKLYEHFKREYIQDAEQHLLDFSLALINNVHVLYQQPTLSPNLDIVIVRYELWKSQPSNLATIVHKNGQAQSLLDAFCRHQARVNPGSDLTDSGHWDHGVLLTGYDIYHTTASVAGVAPVARMCDPLFACSLVEGLHLGRSFVLAHEMGHNMGMVHDGVQNQCSRSCCLMSAVNGAGKTTWSECSVREFNAFLLQLDESGRGNCLRDSNEGIHTHNHLTDGRLPGQRFTADQQCAYFWGRDYAVEIPTGRQMDDICRILWCGNSGSTISTAHPALEGSWCGGNKWCIEGRCRAWPYGIPPPVINGGWSDWSKADSRCPIAQCSITGSIQIKGQHRDCVNPAPNNGGRVCDGSAIRGLVCGSAKSECKGLTRQEFGNKVCSSIKHDPTKPDRQLTGDSFMHDTQPCKVWCHLTDSELIRNKGTFPDGSPCGPGQYCIGGSCLALACGNKAVVDSEADCPDESHQSKWAKWGAWSECSRSCGKGGTQARTRKCKNPFGKSSCIGSSEDYRSCEPAPPPCEQNSILPFAAGIKTNRKMRHVGPWSPWSPCDAQCDDGQQIRTRDCFVDDCSQPLSETRPCNNGPCFLDWTDWTPCTASCGGGTRIRSRICAVSGHCDGPADERELCNTNRCVIESWGDWLPCSVSCGIGFQIRERLCDGVLCEGGNKQARTCNEQPCTNDAPQFVLSDWSEWTHCSETCGEGSQTRTRECSRGDCPSTAPLSDSRRCVIRPCPVWSEWGSWTPCDSCDASTTRSRTRTCSALDSDALCPGDAVDIQSCSFACEGNAPEILTADGRRRVEGQRIQPVNEIRWGEWLPWGSCTVTCGGGVQRRSRLCVSERCHSPLDYEKKRCNEEPCEAIQDLLWSKWADWGECSASCGPGVRRRSRKCRAIFSFQCSGKNDLIEICENAPCPSIREKKAIKVPEWSDWSSWSACSCFTLTETRRRFCKIVDPAMQGFCSGPILEQRKCNPTACSATNGGWSSWSAWSECSRDCEGSGHQIRNRMCSNPLPANRGSYCVGYSFDQRSCSSDRKCQQKLDGGWTDWTDWSECSDNCANGHRSRTRYCASPRPSNGGNQCFGSDFELQPCSDPSKCTNSSDGTWSAWTPWTECPSTCGFAVQSRHRTCEGREGSGAVCEGLAHMTSVCPTDPCDQSVDGEWSEWSAWSKCVANCGIGSRTRTRECVEPAPSDGGAPCFGRSNEVSDCDDTLDICTAAVNHAHVIDAELSTIAI